MTATRVPIAYTSPWTWVLTLFGAPPKWSDIRVDGTGVRVRMSVMFRTRFDRAAVAAVVPHRACVSIGAHGWKGRWLVNGAHKPIATIVLREPVAARVLGFPVQLRELMVSVADVAGLERLLVT